VASADGMNYAPKGRPVAACEEGEFVFAAIGLDHGHIYGMCNGLTEAGGQLKSVYDPDPAKVASLAERFPEVEVAASEAQVLDDPDVQMIAGATVPSDHLGLGSRAMLAGKDYFTDKPALTTLEQLAEARRLVQQTGKKSTRGR
jgi:predicted dehydrogenase